MASENVNYKSHGRGKYLLKATEFFFVSACPFGCKKESRKMENKKVKMKSIMMGSNVCGPRKSVRLIEEVCGPIDICKLPKNLHFSFLRFN